MSDNFSALDQAAATAKISAVLDVLIEQLRAGSRLHELFEALKMRVRNELGLPLTYADSGDELSEETRDRLEDGLISACKEVGTMLLKQGRVRDGWMYLRPVGDKNAAKQLIQEIIADEDNTDELIEVCLHEGVDVHRGFSLILENMGTCNAITTFDSVVAQLRKPDQQVAAELLVRHIHAELRSSVVSDIARQETAQPTESTLAELVAPREWLFGEYSYHVDTTHLASVIRIGRIVENKETIALAFDLTQYGRRLASQFQYKGDEPFLDLYPSHALFYDALLGNRTDEAVEYFRAKAKEVSVAQHGSTAVETFVQLLDRLGRCDEAMDELIRFAEEHERSRQIVPLLLELAGRTGDSSKVREYCRRHDDLLGYATAISLGIN